MEETNVVNDTPQAVVEPATDLTETSGAETGTPEDVTNTEVAPRTQGKSENRAYAKMRREKEASDNTANKLVSGLKQLGFEGETPDEILENIEAKNKNITVEELRKSKAEAEKALKNNPEYKKMELQLIENGIQLDLVSIREVDPSAKPEDLSEQYFILRQNGIDAKVAYNAIKGNVVSPVSKPANIGPVGKSADKENDYFTSAELDRLTSKDLDNPAIYKKAMESLKRL